jgi:tripartite-type tricarboxylate transporter receptor subunit TctC
MKRGIILSVVLTLIVSICGIGFASASSSYPNKPIQVIIGWGAGGGTDLTARGILPLVEKDFKQPFVITNIPGASGAIGADQVLNKKRDGYTLLFGSETITNWPLMGVSKHWYKDFETIAICSQGVATITVNASSPFKTLKEFIDYAKSNPKKIKMAGTGPATTGSVAAAILKKCIGVEVSEVTYGGCSQAVISVLGGQTDVVLENLFAVIDQYKGGKVRILGVFSNQRLKNIPDVPAIGEVYPATKKYLPYGAWTGLFAPKGIPGSVHKKLVNAMKKAVSNRKWQSNVWDNAWIPVGLTGKKAEQLVDNWTSNMAWLIHELGITKRSPKELGIPKPKD